MSLNASQRRQTATELALNAGRCGLTRDELVARSGLSADRFDAALMVEGADPADVWRLRDVLETAVREAGEIPVAYTVLTEEMRASAGRWFGVTDQR